MKLEVGIPAEIRRHLENVSWETMAMIGGAMFGLLIIVVGGKLFIMAVKFSRQLTSGRGVVIFRGRAKNQLALEFDQPSHESHRIIKE